MSIRALSTELQRKAEEELNENPARIQEDLKHVRDWLEKQPHLTVRSDDQSLVGFLRGCKYSLQQTKEKIDYFHTIRTLIPEFFDNRDPFLPEIQEILKAHIVMPLPTTVEAAGPRIFLFLFKNCNPDTMSLANLLKVYFMSIDILMNEDDNCIVAGIFLLSDYAGLSSNYVNQMTPSMLKKFVLCMQGTYPIRLKAAHYFNVPAIFNAVYNIASTFITEKMKSRLFLYNETNSADVYKIIPRSILPKEFGGDNGSLDDIAAPWSKKVESYREWFLEDSKYRSDEKLRPGKPKTSADVFGVEGSFRKLDID